MTVMRWIAALALWLCCATGASAEQIILYKNAAVPLLGNPNWDWRANMGNAYTAMTANGYFHLWKEEKRRVHYAEVLIVATWGNPDWNGYQGVRLNACGPLLHGVADLSDCTQIAWVAARADSGVLEGQGTMACAGFDANPGGPKPCRSVVTEKIQELIDEGRTLYLSPSSYGAGADLKIWDVELSIYWER